VGAKVNISIKEKPIFEFQRKRILFLDLIMTKLELFSELIEKGRASDKSYSGPY